MAFDSLQEIIDTGAKKAKPFWRVVMEEDVQERGVTEESSLAMMENMWNAMFSAVRDYEGNLHSRSGLVGGMGQTMDEYLEKGDTYCGDFVSKVIATALKTGESNACMKRIVAAPTAGACGVLPAVIVPYFEEGKADKDKIIEALYVAAGIGQVIAARAYIAGATGGCQAESGSASAMAAGALVHLTGGNAEQIAQAAAMALKNLLGLVCDPVAGLVEVPCVKRNVVGAVNSLSCADMSLAGIFSKIPPDEVIDAMKEVGDRMHDSLKETAEGGIANTKFARSLVL